MKRAAALTLIAVAGAALAGPAGAAGDRIDKEALGRETFCAITRKAPCPAKYPVSHGLFPTGLTPQFAAGVKCRGIDEHFAIDYAYKRNRQTYHGGIDMPAPFGTPIVAAAAGTVVGVYDSHRGHRGKQVILRHTPEDTGITLYIYTVYAHFERMPKLSVGQRVRMGEVLGPTGNSGAERAHRGGGAHGSRRPAIHFGVYYSASPQYAALRSIVVPLDGRWMDPVALFRGKPPFDSATMKALPARDKKVPIPYMLADGSVHPAGSKLVWPYACARR